MKRFLRRFFPKSPAPSSHTEHSRTIIRDEISHHDFKTPRGQGPFLLSCDGRVIPLRKARFLRQS